MIDYQWCVINALKINDSLSQLSVVGLDLAIAVKYSDITEPVVVMPASYKQPGDFDYFGLYCMFA